jgi:hypothetical protein
MPSKQKDFVYENLKIHYFNEDYALEINFFSIGPKPKERKKFSLSYRLFVFFLNEIYRAKMEFIVKTRTK